MSSPEQKHKPSEPRVVGLCNQVDDVVRTPSNQRPLSSLAGVLESVERAELQMPNQHQTSQQFAEFPHHSIKLRPRGWCRSTLRLKWP